MKRKTTGKILKMICDALEGAEGITNAYLEMHPYIFAQKVFKPDWKKIQKQYEKERKKKSFSQFLSYLRSMGYIEVPEGKPLREGFKLTEKGKSKAMEEMRMTKERSKRKDNKMILLMYDIPEKKKLSREAFRNTLVSLDYRILQKSVWVSDKDVLTETEICIDDLGINNYVNIFLINSIKVHK